MTRAADIYADIHLRSDAMRGEIATTRRLLTGFQTDIAKLSGPARGFLLATGAAVAVAVKAFADGERANESLRSALRATGNEVDGNYRKYSAYADAIARVTTLSHDGVIQLQTLALNLGVSAKNVDEVVKAGIGLGQRYFGGDYAQGLKAASLATEGNLRQLQRLIPELQRYHTIQSALRVINRNATAGFKEAEDQTKTFSGAMKLLQNNVYEARKVLGEAFAPELLAAAKNIEQITEAIRNMTPEQRESLVMWTKLTAGVAGSLVVLDRVGRIATGLRGIFGVVGSVVGATAPEVAGVAAALALIGAAYVNLAGQGDSFSEKFASIWERSKKSLSEFGDTAKKEWAQDWDAIVMIYFRAHDAMFGGDASEDFKNYIEGVRQEQEKYRKEQEAAAAKAFADKKNGVNAQVQLEKEKNARMRGEFQGAFMDASAYYKKIQIAILQSYQTGPTINPPGKAGAKNPAPVANAPAAGGGGVAAANPPVGNAPPVPAGANPGAAAAPDAAQVARIAKLRLDENMAIARLASLDRQRQGLHDRIRRNLSVGVDANGGTTEYANDPNELKKDRADLGRNATARAVEDAKRLKAQNELTALTGETSIDGKRASKRAEVAKKELAGIDAKLKNLDSVDAAVTGNFINRQINNPGDEKGDPTQTYDSTKAGRALLEATRRRLQGLISRGGVDAPDRPFDRDQVGGEIGQLMRDARDAHAAGVRLGRRANEIYKGSPLTDEEQRRQLNGADYSPDALARRAGQAFRREETDNQAIRELQARFKSVGKDRSLKDLQETPGSKQDAQFGTNVKALSEAAKVLGKAGYDLTVATKELREANKNTRTVGVLRE